MSEKNNILLPCPFCGGEAKIIRSTRIINGGCNLFSWEIKCSSCGASVKCDEYEAIRYDKEIRLTIDGKKELITA